MPIYEYQCDKCHHHLEALQKISDKPLRECPECGKHALKRLLSAPMFRLAGSGWYETDFKSDKETKRNLAGREEPASAPAESAATGDTTSAKPEATPAKVDKAPAERQPAAAARGTAAKPAASVKKTSKPAASPRKAARTR
jgi:putative FmdB family regulatory protein